jgi:hypothetical protein
MYLTKKKLYLAIKIEKEKNENNFDKFFLNVKSSLKKAKLT